MTAPADGRVLVLDFGSQVTQLIARRVREAGVYCEILPCTAGDARIHAFAPAAIVLSGGPASATAAQAPAAPAAVFQAGVPILGICYGQQTLCAQLGGAVEAAGQREFGRAFLDVAADCLLFEGLWQVGERHQVWMSHGDRVAALPPGFRTVATSQGSPFAAIADDERRIYGLQFHPEVAHTPDGGRLIANFVHKAAGIAGDWTMAAFRTRAVAAIRRQVGEGRVLMGLSGGIDSTVAALLIHEAIGRRLACVFVDNGLMRLGEGREVAALFNGRFATPPVAVDAGALFLARLAGVTDPEAKRKIVGATFIDVFEAEAAKLGGADFLGQGTLYPDVIESVSFHGGPSATIKSHHNVGGLPERMALELVEPLRELFKDEVRALGRTLGLPQALVGRHPFPGPGLAVRIPGEVTAAKVAMLQKADAIYIEELRRAGLYDAIWQAFAVLLPVLSVGVMGDGRSYEHVCALRAVASSDGMTAEAWPFEHAFLDRLAGRIVAEVAGINRVVYDLTSKPPGTIEWE